ncbi:MAG: S8 family serine peptidase [Proteobacteria bacterium]|nr:S8 family serine peptidase [Pseudomonadota bacterium]
MMTHPVFCLPCVPGSSGRHAGKRTLRLAGLALVMVLGACGGGGGGSSSDAQPPATPSQGGSDPVETPEQQTPVEMAAPAPTLTPPSLPSLPPDPSTLCIQTVNKGCLGLAEFDNEVSGRMTVYENQRNFNNQWGLSSIRAQRAYAHMELLTGLPIDPGEGVTVGFVDSGIDLSHQLFAGSTINEVFLAGAVNETGTRFSHGTAVASVAAAPRIVTTVNAGHGVAWGANIAMFAIPTGRGPAGYNPITLSGLQSRDSFWTTVINGALNWRSGTRTVDFLNLSVGSEGIINSYSVRELRANFGNAIAAMAQHGVNEKTVLVWAAGNGHGDSCVAGQDHCRNLAINAVSVEVLPGLMARIPELRGHTVAVAAIGEDGLITDFSNRCGIAANWCLAAPGEDILATYFGPHEGQDGFRGIATVDGTSFAAPMVTGGLAVMKQLFRNQLSNTALLSRLLDTANDRGIYANRAVYGHGLMDLGAATSPVGLLEVPRQTDIGTPGVLLQNTQLLSSPAFGDGLVQSLRGHEMAAFDALGAPFWFDLGSFAAPAYKPPMNVQMQDFLSGVPDTRAPLGEDFDFIYVQELLSPGLSASRWRLGLMEMPGAGQAGHFARAEPAVALSVSGPSGFSASAFTSEGVAGETPATGALVSWQAAGTPVALHAGWLGEPDSLLGARAQGAFGELGADAVFFGLSMDSELAGWALGASAEIGRVRPASTRGLITGVSSLATSTFAVRATREVGEAGTFRLSVSQPLRIEGGRASLKVPVGRTPAGTVLQRSMTARLAPSGRQVDVAAHWRQPLVLGEWRFGATWSHEPEHRENAEAEFTLLSGWLYSF